MKIVSRDSEKMVLRPEGTILAILFGLVFVVAGLGIVALTSIEYRLSCDRVSGGQAQCRLSQGLFGIALKQESVNGLRGARLDSRESTSRSNGRTRTTTVYQVVLITANGERWVGASGNIDVAGQERFVGSVDVFAQSPNLTNLDIAYGGAKLWWFGAIFVLVGLIMAVSGLQSMFTTWTFDREQGVLVKRSETLLGIRVYEYALRDVVGVQVASSCRTTTTHAGGHHHHHSQRVHSLEVSLRNGESIPLTYGNSSGYNDMEHIAMAIREFLQLQ